ncbi:glycine--tRNA ligase subunit beta [Thiosocius teredinicola]|uniref:glycine--tRNA ligase subunit beta n=1 Tax=Thiosocius teredinicola TaxID=1973002 RepID=UPI002FE43C43
MSESMIETANLIFELGTEELPPKALKKLSVAFTEEFVKGLNDAGLQFGEVSAYAAPRRLALLVRDCATAQPDRDIERRGPALKAAYDGDGNPTKAAEGFAKSCNTTVDQLQKLETDKGSWLVFNVHQKGQQAVDLLPGIAENALNKLPIPKRMRWGDSDAQFVRPVHWLLFMLGDSVVPCTLLDAKASKETYGHRFHHPHAITLYSPDDYAEVLGSLGKVIAHFDTRRARVKHLVEQAAGDIGGVPDLDDDLLDEVTALNEWPMPITGTFEERFLEVPQEALVATMKGNQKYFPVFSKDGQLMNKFITIANIESKQPDLIRQGNERVVRPRLADAMFFWEQDGKKRLQDHVGKLEHVVFQKDLGSMRDKSARVAELAAFIAQHVGGDEGLTRRAGELSRCDLMTEMVFEFPEMQGIMGRYQARRDGEPDELALAMDEFYMPRFSGDRLPETKTGIAISLAEKIDTLVGIFGIGLKPTGDKDPFALRRAALGALRILREHALPIDLVALLQKAEAGLQGQLKEQGIADQVYDFMLERLKGIYSDSGTSHDTFEAVANIRPKTIADFEHRIRVVTDFRALPEAEALSAANKRIGNILKKTDEAVPDQVDPDLFELTAEKALHDHLLAAEKAIAPLMAESNYGAALQVLAHLRGPVDTFFDDVMVMAEKAAVRGNRLAMLKTMSQQFLQVADISVLQV